MVPQTSSISSNPQVVWMGIFDMFEKVNSWYVFEKFLICVWKS